MAQYDVLVVGGGTCLNCGCNPSKLLIQAATSANNVCQADRVFLDATLGDVADAIHAHRTLNDVVEYVFQDVSVA